MASPVLAATTYQKRHSQAYDKSAVNTTTVSDRATFKDVDALTALASILTPHDDRAQTYASQLDQASRPSSTEKESRAIRSMSSRHTTTLKKIGSRPQLDQRADAEDRAIDTHTAMPGEAEIMGAVRSMAQDRLYRTPNIPGPSTRQSEEQQHSPISETEYAVVLPSTAKSPVPTSRYNRTPSFTRPERSNTVHRSLSNKALLPRTSPIVNSETDRRSLTADAQAMTVSSAPATGDRTARGMAAETAMSEQRSRGLHSHPSNASIVSRARSTVDDADVDDAPLVSRLRSRPSSIKSHTQSFRSSQQLSPAPTTPLPELPPLAMRRPPTRERDKLISVPNPLLASQIAPVSPQLHSSVYQADKSSHAEMADFMLTQRMTVFRRFDEVHIRLLLQLQDEISVLERNLWACERKEHERLDQSSEKSRIMRELRKKVGEYDLLFANWSSMQANKASPELKQDLSTWLQNSRSGNMSPSAPRDLAWLQNTHDLSAVSTDPEKKPHEAGTSNSPTPQEAHGGGGSSFFSSLFGACTGRRK